MPISSGSGRISYSSRRSPPAARGSTRAGYALPAAARDGRCRADHAEIPDPNGRDPARRALTCGALPARMEESIAWARLAHRRPAVPKPGRTPGRRVVAWHGGGDLRRAGALPDASADCDRVVLGRLRPVRRTALAKCRAYNLDYVISGTIQASGSAHPRDGDAAGRVAWISRSSGRRGSKARPSDLFKLQDTIASQTVAQIDPELLQRHQFRGEVDADGRTPQPIRAC